MNYERDVEKYLVSQVEKNGGLCLKLGREGWPDRISIWPGGRVDFIEVKRAGGFLSAIQRQRLNELAKRKARVHVFFSKADVNEYIEARVR
jgi:hypothetical protein